MSCDCEMGVSLSANQRLIGKHADINSLGTQLKRFGAYCVLAFSTVQKLQPVRDVSRAALPDWFHFGEKDRVLDFHTQCAFMGLSKSVERSLRMSRRGCSRSHNNGKEKGYETDIRNYKSTFS